MKKILSFTLATLMLTAVLASCAKEGDMNDDNTPAVTTTSSPDNSNTTDTTAPSDESSDTTADSKLEESLTDIFAAIYEKRKVGIMLGTNTLDLTNADSLAYNTGLSSADNIIEVVMSEAMIGSQANSSFLMRVEDGADIDAIKQAIINGINPRKWICVGADKVIVCNSGNIIYMVMSADNLIPAEELYNAFAEVVGTVGEKLVRDGNS
jgi:hypothetical protein